MRVARSRPKFFVSKKSLSCAVSLYFKYALRLAALINWLYSSQNILEFKIYATCRAAIGRDRLFKDINWLSCEIELVYFLSSNPAKSNCE